MVTIRFLLATACATSWPHIQEWRESGLMMNRKLSAASIAAKISARHLAESGMLRQSIQVLRFTFSSAAFRSRANPWSVRAYEINTSAMAHSGGRRTINRILAFAICGLFRLGFFLSSWLVTLNGD